MSILAEFARERLVKRVTLAYPDGREEDVDMRVPVGAEAVEFLADLRGVTMVALDMASIRDSLGFGDSADVGKLLADAEGRAQYDTLADAKDRLDQRLADLAAKWLPRLVDDLAERTERQVATVVRRTGGADSPLVAALQDMADAAGGGTEEGLEALPFS